MNTIYHESRELWYSRVLNWTTFISIVFSSAAIAALGDFLPAQWQSLNGIIAASCAALIAVLNAAILSFGVIEKAKLHTILRIRWIQALGKAQRISPEASPEDVKKVVDEFVALATEEPPPIPSILESSFVKTRTAMGLLEGVEVIKNPQKA